MQIHHSRNLGHWRLLTRPLRRSSQLNMLGFVLNQTGGHMKMNRIVILFGLLLLTGAVLNLSVGHGQTSLPPYKNPSLHIEKRVDDLVSRMTLEEKVSQMITATPAIASLGIS